MATFSPTGTKTILIACFTLLLILLGGCQHRSANKGSLQNPESAIINPISGDLLISCVEGKNIMSRNPRGKLKEFAGQLTAPKGMTIVGDTLFVADVTMIRALSLKNGKELWNLPIPGAKFLNDLTNDHYQFIYCSDMEKNRIIRVDIQTHEITDFTDPMLERPNGLWFDQKNQVIFLVSNRLNSPLQMLDFTKRKLDTIYPSTLSNLDGIVEDEQGNFYVTSWDAQGVFKIDSQFRSQPHLVKGNLNGPADLFYDKDKKQLIIPVMMEDRIETVSLTK